MNRESVVFYKGFYEALKELDAEDKAAAYEAIVEYGLFGIEPECTGVVKALFLMAKPQIDQNNKRYENALKGGAPVGNSNAKKTTEEQPTDNQKQPKNNLKQPTDNQKQPNTQNKQPNDNDNVNDNDNDIKEKINKKESRFIPPTVDEVREYCGERGLTVNAESFVDFYRSKDWYVGKTKMTDWHASCRNWSRNQLKEEQRATGARDRPKNKFCNFKQRDDDLDALAKQLATQGMEA